MTPPTKLDLCSLASGIAAGVVVPLEPRPLIALGLTILAGWFALMASRWSR